MKLEGKVAIVTGGAQGIGEGVVRCFAQEGADVVIPDINGDAATKLANDVKAMGRKALPIRGDLTDSMVVAKVVQDTINTFGKIDILVNCAGGSTRAALKRTSLRFVDSTDEQCDEDYQLNFKIAVMMSRAVMPHLMNQNSGKIVNIASIAGRGGGGYYGAMKAGIISLTKTLAAELGPYSVNVNSICPGLIYTPANWAVFAAQHVQILPQAKGMTAREYFLQGVSRSPLRREQTPEDIGKAAVFFASEDAKNITGQSLNVDGGLVMS